MPPPTDSNTKHKVATHGQVFTPSAVVNAMLALKRNRGRVLEPACGDGAFLRCLPDALGIELDPEHAPAGAQIMDFFALPTDERFATIIGNPPYVRYQDILPDTRRHIKDNGDSTLDGRANLYLFFIEKCLRHLATDGELIFITPRDFLKATSAVPLNRLLFAAGTITDFIDLGDLKLFDGATPNCAIWRFVRGDFSRSTRYARLGAADGVKGLERLVWGECHFNEIGGHLQFTRGNFSGATLRLADLAFVKVGAVSGADELYASTQHGTRDFVCSATVKTGATRRMIWVGAGDPPHAILEAHKERLIARRIRPFDDSNWWHWGRGYYQSAQARVYVNSKTRQSQPFFVHDCPHYDGAVLAIFPRDPAVDVQSLAAALNSVDWVNLGFVCDGRFLFTQRSLEHATLPESFRAFMPPGDTTSGGVT